MAKKLWGGRFQKKTDPLVEEFTKSISYDAKLALYDVLGSAAHVQILKAANFLTSEEADKLDAELKVICDNIVEGNFVADINSEDIHTNIQNELQKKVGDVALKLHTARSRNDQVAFATKWYCKDAIVQLRSDVKKLKETIEEVAKANNHIIIPGFTHMQHAQPVYLSDYLLTYVAMLQRDTKKFEDIYHNMTITLGAGALAGTPIDADTYARIAAEFLKDKVLAKNFKIEATTNSLDAVSDRDFVLDILSDIAILGMHLSRLAEDLIIWSTKEFDFIEIDESYCTGSSLMPQKKNPDVLELIRGYTGRYYGNLISVLTMMKGLPLTYNRDMQLDKEPLFDSFDKISKELNVLNGLIKTIKFNEDVIKNHLKDESFYATDMVYYLVKRGEPFTTAHTNVGKLFKHAIDHGMEIKNMPQSDLDKFSAKLKKEEIVELFNAEKSVEAKKSIKR